jgi:hypothetical protein
MYPTQEPPYETTWDQPADFEEEAAAPADSAAKKVARVDRKDERQKNDHRILLGILFTFFVYRVL